MLARKLLLLPLFLAPFAAHATPTYFVTAVAPARGAVAGSGFAGGNHKLAFMDSPGGSAQSFNPFGGNNSLAAGINNLGQVVGHSQGSFYGNHGFLFSDGAMIDPNTLIDPALGWNIVNAVDINNHGRIAAYGFKGGVGYALRLDLASAVPEPASVVLLLGGLVLLGFGARHRPSFQS
jgi:probable HAF family extracellular repeat protein